LPTSPPAGEAGSGVPGGSPGCGLFRFYRFNPLLAAAHGVLPLFLLLFVALFAFHIAWRLLAGAAFRSFGVLRWNLSIAHDVFSLRTRLAAGSRILGGAVEGQREKFVELPQRGHWQGAMLLDR
jgi:hypothetical protein